MSGPTGADWRGWVLLIFTIAAACIGSSLGLFFRAEAYADGRTEQVRREVCENLSEMRQDLRAIREDLRLLARPESCRGERP